MKSVKSSEIQFLKFFVYLMGFVLIFATLFLMYVIYKKNYIDIIDQTQANDKCVNLNLNVEGKIQNITVEEGLVNIIWKDQIGSYKVSIHDYCNGNVINEFTITEQSNNQTLEPSKYDESHLDDKNIIS